jgi:polyisoprenoid-binding protein YceI
LLFAAWYFVLKTDPAPRAEIKDTPTVAASAAALDGTYTVAPGNTSNFVGYRVTEQFVGAILNNTATGRTDHVTGTMVISGTRVSNVTVTADLRSLVSDNSSRDHVIHDLGLESNRFPRAKFVATRPITLAAVPAVGENITTKATGKFTLHGVTKSVVVPLVGRWDGKRVQVVGTLPIVFGDYHIGAPTVGPVASIDDHAEMEFQLFFDKPTSNAVR